MPSAPVQVVSLCAESVPYTGALTAQQSNLFAFKGFCLECFPFKVRGRVHGVDQILVKMDQIVASVEHAIGFAHVVPRCTGCRRLWDGDDRTHQQHDQRKNDEHHVVVMVGRDPRFF